MDIPIQQDHRDNREHMSLQEQFEGQLIVALIILLAILLRSM